MDAFRATYEVAHDPQVSRRVRLAAMRSFWRRWLAYGLNWGGSIALFGLFNWIIVSYYVRQYSSNGLFAIIAFSLCVGLLLPFYYYIRAWDKREKDPYLGEIWQCEMTALGWSFRSKSGMVRFIPWELIRPTFEHGDGWIAKCEEVELLIYRKPLREAGLEDEFRSRMGQRPSHTSEEA